MRPDARFRWMPCLGLGSLALGLAGCAAPMQPLADFGQAAHALAGEWRPFVPAVRADCERIEWYKLVTLPGAYDVRVARRQATATCAALGAEARTAELFASALEGYAHALSTLAGTHSGVFDEPLAGLETTAEGLQTAEGTALFDASRLQSAERLARTAARVATARAETTLARGILADHQADLAAVVGAMKQFADTIATRPESQQLLETADGQLGRLVTWSNADAATEVQGRLLWRFAQDDVVRDIDAAEGRAKRVSEFDAAADQLVAAHAALLREFDHLSHVERLQSVDDLITRVKALSGELRGK